MTKNPETTPEERLNLEARRDYLQNVSHELKTPVTAIKGFVETLQDWAIDRPEEARRYLAILSRHVDRLNATIEDVLTLSKIEQESMGGEIPLMRQPIRPILESSIESCNKKALKMGISLELDCDSSEADINPFLLERAVTNLLENAVNHSGSSNPVQIFCRCEAAEVVIGVRDSGVGISEGHLPRIFERFYRVDKEKSRAAGGTGLGLSIVKRIAEAHGGEVEVTSRPGEGSQFTLHIPIKSKENQSKVVDRLTAASQKYYRHLTRSIYLFDPDR